MNFYKHYIGDFQRDTGHLSLTERGAYRALLDAFYASEKPLPGNAIELCRVVGAFTKTERAAITRVLKEFWREEDGGWVNARAQREISKADHQRDVNRAIAVSREANRKATRSDNESSHEPSTNRATNDQPNQTPDTRHQTKNKRGGTAGRGTRLPPDWELTPERAEYAKSEGLDPQRTFHKFRDYWLSAAGIKGVKLDWDATWRNWCRTDRDRGVTNGKTAAPANDAAATAWADLIASDGAKRDAKVQAALDACGGWLAIKGRNNFNEAKLRAEFCDAYRRAA